MLLTALLLASVSPPHDRDDDEKPRAIRPPAALNKPNEVAPKLPRPSAPVAAPADGDELKPNQPADSATRDNEAERDADDVPKRERAVATSAHNDEADDDEEEARRVQPNSTIVVTARRLDAARTQIDAGLGATVYTLTNDAIENRPGGETGSIADILEQAPGVTLSGRTLNIRGTPATQVRINNVIVPEAISDPADQLSSRLAQTTRLITGTLPAQFGFAPGGVISITTKNGLYQHGGQAELFAGSDGMIEPALEWAGSLGGTSLFASASSERDRATVGDALGYRARERRSAVEGLGFADHVIDDENRVSLLFGGGRERHRIGATSVGPGTQSNEDAYSVATLQHSDGGFTLQASIFGGVAANRADFLWRTRERRGSWGSQVDGSEAIGTSHTLRFGLLATRSTAWQWDAESARARSARTSVAVYAQDEWKLSPALTFNPGGRLEWLAGLGAKGTIEPRASLVWAPTGGLTTHVGYARYAAAAPLRETSAAAALPNERDDYFDAGAQQKLGAFTIGLDGYWRVVRNLMAERQVIGSAAPETLQFARGRVRGVELSGTYARHGTTAWANLALSKAEAKSIVAGSAVLPSSTIAAPVDSYVPLASDRPCRISAGFTQRIGRFSLSADALLSSGAVRTVTSTDSNGSRHPAYSVFGLAAVYHAQIVGRAADIRLDLTNLGNAHYETNDASGLEGGWTRYGRRRALTIGIEQGF